MPLTAVKICTLIHILNSEKYIKLRCSSHYTISKDFVFVLSCCFADKQDGSIKPKELCLFAVKYKTNN